MRMAMIRSTALSVVDRNLAQAKPDRKETARIPGPRERSEVAAAKVTRHSTAQVTSRSSHRCAADLCER